MKQGGLTTVSPEPPRADTAFDGALVAAGRFAEVAPVDRKRTFWRTESTLSTASGKVLATASIVFGAASTIPSAKWPTSSRALPQNFSEECSQPRLSGAPRVNQENGQD